MGVILGEALGARADPGATDLQIGETPTSCQATWDASGGQMCWGPEAACLASLLENQGREWLSIPLPDPYSSGSGGDFIHYLDQSSP